MKEQERLKAQAIQDEERRKFREYKELEKIHKKEELRKKTEENQLKEKAQMEERQNILAQKEKERIEVSIFKFIKIF